MEQVLRDTDWEKLSDSRKNLLEYLADFRQKSPELEDRALDYCRDNLAAELGRDANHLIAYLNEVEKKRPGYLSDLIAAFLNPVESAQLKVFVRNLLQALVGSIPEILSWAGDYLKEKLLANLFKMK